MSKQVLDSPITTRNARSKLAPRNDPYWRALDPDVHLGYRKGENGGRWKVRWRVEGKYKEITIGTADDVMPADGVSTFDYPQALAAARESISKDRATATAEAAGPVLTVRSAVSTYVTMREAREAAQRPGAPLKRDARSRLTLHVLTKPIADAALHELDEDDLSGWLDSVDGLSATSITRLVNDFKAALNAAADSRKAVLSHLPAVIKSGLKLESTSSAGDREIQVLPDSEIRSAIAAAKVVDARDGWEGDLLRLVVVLAATGARFSQVARMRVGDVKAALLRLMVPMSHKGRAGKGADRYAVSVGPDVLALLRPAIAGRKSGEPLLERWHYRQERGENLGQLRWVRDRRGPWVTASEMLRPWREIVAEAKLAADIIPYCLRHSSIVRCLGNLLPVQLVARLHDTSVEMIQRHYAAYIVDALTEVARGAVVPLLEADEPG